MNAPAATAATILDVAQRLTQSFGYHGLSFRDLAAEVGIKSASVHYHFPSKGKLAAAVARRYTDHLVDRLKEVDARDTDPAAAFAAYAAVFREALQHDGRMCLCGMLAAETDAIPPEVRAEVRRFVDLNVQWIARVLARQTGGTVAREKAMALFAALEGAMLVARGIGDIASFDAMVEQIARSGLMGAQSDRPARPGAASGRSRASTPGPGPRSSTPRRPGSPR